MKNAQMRNIDREREFDAEYFEYEASRDKYPRVIAKHAENKWQSKPAFGKTQCFDYLQDALNYSLGVKS